MRAFTLVSAVALGFAAGSCGNQGNKVSDADRTESIKAYVATLAEGGAVPGIAIAIVRDGRPFQTMALGSADLSTKDPVTADTPFQLASTTKIFSSTAVLLFVADGRIRLDDAIGGHLEGLPKGWQGVTIRQLLSHTSGLPDIAVRPGELELVADDWQAALKIVAGRPLQFAPGERWAYTQTNYALLQRLVERLSGDRFQAFLDKRLFVPLGMSNTFFPSPGRHCATNYERGAGSGLVVRDLSFPAYVNAAGGLCSSLNDLLKWDASLAGGKLLPANLATLATSPAALGDGSRVTLGGSASYGLGWAIHASPEHGWVGHSGGNTTVFRRYPSDRLSIVVLHNGVANPDAIADRLAQTMLQTQKGGESQPDLWDSAMTGNPSGIEEALAAGADINALDTRSNPNGRRALNWAAANNHADAIRLLLKSGANIDAQNLSGFTALDHAAEEGATEAARVLLEAGANTTLKTKAGSTAAEIARANGHPDLAQLIDGADKRR